MKLKKYFWLLLPVAILALLFLVNRPQANAMKATVYKSSTCGCCVNYIALLKEEGYEVEIVVTEDMSSIKQQYDVPFNMESCHTMIVGGYVVEGHTPFEAVAKLLEDKPDINGIALPDMPAGSPGMPGVKSGLFTIYALTNNEPSIYLQQ